MLNSNCCANIKPPGSGLFRLGLKDGAVPLFCHCPLMWQTRPKPDRSRLGKRFPISRLCRKIIWSALPRDDYCCNTIHRLTHKFLTDATFHLRALSDPTEAALACPGWSSTDHSDGVPIEEQSQRFLSDPHGVLPEKCESGIHRQEKKTSSPSRLNLLHGRCPALNTSITVLKYGV